MDEKQLDLFNDFDRAWVFTCIAGAYIGRFSQGGDEPVERLSAYFANDEDAEAALTSGTWSLSVDITRPEHSGPAEQRNNDQHNKQGQPICSEKNLRAEFGLALLIRDTVDQYRRASAEEIIDAALDEMRRRFARGQLLTNPADTQHFFQLRLAHLEHEVFAALWLDNRHRIIEFETLFRGTIDGASVHTREVVKSALKYNAAACIFAHNHPSGDSSPSRADQQITQRLKEALSLVDVRALDHIVVAENTCSFAELGLL